MDKVRRQYSAQEKVRILREHLIEKAAVSDVCERHGLNPTVFYRWQNVFFENGAAAFEHRSDAVERKQAAKIEKLQAKLAQKDEVIAEIMASHVQLKKELGEL
ncbi:MAG: transposase [Phycisphaerae bacterium]